MQITSDDLRVKRPDLTNDDFRSRRISPMRDCDSLTFAAASFVPHPLAMCLPLGQNWDSPAMWLILRSRCSVGRLPGRQIPKYEALLCKTSTGSAAPSAC